MARYHKGFAAWTPKGHDWVWKRFISARKIANHEAVQATPFENVVVTRAVANTIPTWNIPTTRSSTGRKC